MALSVRVYSQPPLRPVPTVGAWLSRVPRRRRTTAASPAVAVVCALYAYEAAISRSATTAPLGSAATYMPTYVYARLCLAAPGNTRCLDSVRTAECLRFGALRLSSTLLSLRAIMCTEYT